MALVPVTLSGTFDLTSAPDSPTDFNVFIAYQGGCPVASNWNITTDLAALKAFIDSIFTGLLSGTITTSTVTYSAPILTIDIVGTGDNAASNGVGAIFTSSALSGGTNCLAFYFGQDCPDCPPSVNPEDATDCLSCYEQYAVNCETPITIQGLDASTEYVITISDNVSGKNYSYTTTTDTNGEADIDTADFPTGLFSPYNSPFTLTITENGVPVTLTYGYVNYSCISLNITNTETA